MIFQPDDYFYIIGLSYLEDQLFFKACKFLDLLALSSFLSWDVEEVLRGQSSPCTVVTALGQQSTRQKKIGSLNDLIKQRYLPTLAHRPIQNVM